MSDLKLQSQVQFAIRSTQVPRPRGQGEDICDSGMTKPFVKHLAEQDTDADVASLSGRALVRPTFSEALEDRVLDSWRKSDGVAQRAALLAAAHLAGSPGLAAGLLEAGRQVNRLVDTQFKGHPEADAIRVGAAHRFLEALRDLGDPAARAALQVSSLPGAAAVAVSLFQVGDARTGPRTEQQDAQYVAKVGGLAIDRVYGHEGAGSGTKVELAKAFIGELASSGPVSAHAQAVGDLMKTANHERITTLLGRTALEAFTYIDPHASTDHVLAQAGKELYRDAGIRASACDLNRKNYATTMPKADPNKQLRAAAAIAGWMATQGNSDVRDLAAMTVQTRSANVKATYLEVPYATLFDMVAAD